MDDPIENATKSNVQTPRRTLGMRRISPRNINLVKHKVNEAAETTSIEHENENFSETPKRSRYQDSQQKNEEKCEATNNEAELRKYEKYKTQKGELIQLIDLWKIGGQKALEMLQAEIKPEQSLEEILRHLKLPENIFD